MTINEAIKLHNKMERIASPYIEIAQHANQLMRALAPTFETMYPTLIRTQQQINIFTEAISPAIIEAAQHANQLMRALAPTFEAMYPTLIRTQQQINIFTEAMSPAIIEAVQLTKKFAESFAPIIKYIHAFQQTGYLSNIQTLAQTLVSSPGIEYFGNEDDGFDKISSQEKQEIADAIIKTFDEPYDPLNFQQSVMKRYESFQTKNPLIAKIFWGMLKFILLIIATITSNIITNVIQPTVLREKPTQSSQKIYNVTVDQSVTIINEAPYYYEISFTDDETGKTITGWISKRSIRPPGYAEETRVEDKEDKNCAN